VLSRNGHRPTGIATVRRKCRSNSPFAPQHCQATDVRLQPRNSNLLAKCASCFFSPRLREGRVGSFGQSAASVKDPTPPSLSRGGRRSHLRP